MKIAFFLGAALLAGSMALAQTPVPVVVQAAASSAAPAAIPVAPPNQAANSGHMASALKSLEAMKAANAEVLKKQAATLQQLDELQKAAEQLRIYSKRG